MACFLFTVITPNQGSHLKNYDSPKYLENKTFGHFCGLKTKSTTKSTRKGFAKRSSKISVFKSNLIKP